MGMSKRLVCTVGLRGVMLLPDAAAHEYKRLAKSGVRRFALGCVLLIGLLGAVPAHASSGIRLSSTTFGASGMFTFNGILACDLLLSFTLSSRTIVKRTGINQATANGGFINNCAGSLAGAPNSGAILGPLLVQYGSFAGTLPSISRIDVGVTNMGWSVNMAWGNCLFAGPWSGLGFAVNAGLLTSVDMNITSSLARQSGSILCPSTITMLGVLATMLPAPPSVTLI